MKNKKGFTLVEMMAVIIVMALVVVIATIALNTISNASKTRTFKMLATNVASATKEAYAKCIADGSNKFCQDHIDFDDSVMYDVVTLGELIGYKYLDPIENPWKSGEQCSSDSTIKVTRKSSKELDYDYEVCLVCGDKKTCEPLKERGLQKIYTGPGVYDADGMVIATWDELVNTYGLNVENDYDGILADDPAQADNALGSKFYQGTGKTPVKLVMPNDITRIGKKAFNGVNLKEIVLPKSLVSIGDDAFINANDLEKLVIPASVTDLGETLFIRTGRSSFKLSVNPGNPKYDSRDDCNCIIETAKNELVSGTAATVIPNTVTSIGDSAFSNVSISTINIPNSVTNIGDYALSGTDLWSITIPNSVTSIGSMAFFMQDDITSVTIPASVNNIGNNPFAYTGVTSITVDANNPKYDSRDNCNCIIETATNELKSGAKTTVIPSTVTSIGDYAFESADIRSVTIPSGVTYIGTSAFSGNSNLKSITIPVSVKTISYGAFSGTGLTSATFETTSGWVINNGRTLSSSSLANKSTAATYLKSTYAYDLWTRN